jgi:hypothetical protein
MKPYGFSIIGQLLSTLASKARTLLSKAWQCLSTGWQCLLNCIRVRWSDVQNEFRHRVELAELARRMKESQASLRKPVSSKLMGFLVGLESGKVLSLWDGINAFRLSPAGIPVRVDASSLDGSSDHEIAHEIEVRRNTIIWQNPAMEQKRELLSNDILPMGPESFCVKLLPSDRQGMLPRMEGT